MDISAYFDFLRNIFSLIPLNIVDYIFILILLVYVFEDASFGIIAAGISLASTLSAFFIGIVFYHPFSSLLVNIFSLPKGISDAIAFMVVTVFSFIVVSLIASVIRKKYVKIVFPKQVDFIGGAIFGLMSFFFIASFAVALLLSFPLSQTIKDSVRSSVTGKFLSSRTQSAEGVVRNIFGGAIDDTINFLTVKPDSGKSVALNFITTDYKVDEASEKEMLGLVNKERLKRGLSTLAPDPLAQEVAREHARDMLERGYFSHYTPEGLSPFDRIDMANVSYQFAGENLAFAPDTQIAMDGLMKSTGHRENILSSDFRRAGIGVLDAGIYGKMFVQIFRD